MTDKDDPSSERFICDPEVLNDLHKAMERLFAEVQCRFYMLTRLSPSSSMQNILLPVELLGPLTALHMEVMRVLDAFEVASERHGAHLEQLCREGYDNWHVGKTDEADQNDLPF
jgi:hypothetical protein